MQLIIFIGIPGSGKSTYYCRHYLKTHVRISLDLLKTRNKENKFLAAGFKVNQKMIIDNTNVKKKERAKYIQLAKDHKYKISGYYFNADPKECLKRNNSRVGKEKVADKVIFIKYHQLEKPTLSEGFDEIFEVKMINNEFLISEYIEGNS